MSLLSRVQSGEDLQMTSIMAQVKALESKRGPDGLADSGLDEKQQQAIKKMAETVIAESSQALTSFSGSIEKAASLVEAKEIILAKSKMFMIATLNLSNGSEQATRFIVKRLFFDVVKKNTALAPHREELFNLFLGTNVFTQSSTAVEKAGLEDLTA